MKKEELANFIKPYVRGYGVDNDTNALQLADNLMFLIGQPKAAPDMWGQVKQVIAFAQKHYPLAANWMINMSGKTFSEKDCKK